MINQTHTAAISYEKSTEVVSTINDRVEQFIRSNPNTSRNEIQMALNLTARQTTCSTWHLLKKGIIKVCGTKEDLVTNREVETLEINPTPEIVFKKVSDKEKIERITKLCESNNGDFYIPASEILSIISL